MSLQKQTDSSYDSDCEMTDETSRENIVLDNAIEDEYGRGMMNMADDVIHDEDERYEDYEDMMVRCRWWRNYEYDHVMMKMPMEWYRW